MHTTESAMLYIKVVLYAVDQCCKACSLLKCFLCITIIMHNLAIQRTRLLRFCTCVHACVITQGKSHVQALLEHAEFLQM